MAPQWSAATEERLAEGRPRTALLPDGRPRPSNEALLTDRESRGLSMRQHAGALGVAYSTYSSWFTASRKAGTAGQADTEEPIEALALDGESVGASMAPPSVVPPSVATPRAAAVYSAVVGRSNSQLIEAVARIYLPTGDDDYVCDATWGRGVFWRSFAEVNVVASDMVTMPEGGRHDFRKLPYMDDFFAASVLDPPYRHHGGSWLSHNYQNQKTTGEMSHADIIQMYRDGMREMKRITRPRGTIWVKTQNEIESGHQKWSHHEIFDIGTKELGLECVDEFVFVQESPPAIQGRQKHARKSHSYLLIFRKPIARTRKRQLWHFDGDDLSHVGAST